MVIDELLFHCRPSSGNANIWEYFRDGVAVGPQDIVWHPDYPVYTDGSATYANIHGLARAGAAANGMKRRRRRRRHRALAACAEILHGLSH